MSKNVTNTICVLFAEHEKLNIYSFNTNGLGNTEKEKTKDLLDFLRKQSGNLIKCMLIYGDQKWFLKWFFACLFVLENIRLPYNNPYSNKRGEYGLLYMIDSEMAFDSMACSFIKKSLIKFNIGSSFARWVPFKNIFIVTLIPVCQLIDTILNESMFNEAGERVIPIAMLVSYMCRNHAHYDLPN